MTTLMFALVAAILIPATANAQKKTYWRIPSTLGGAMVGAGVGWGFDVARDGAPPMAALRHVSDSGGNRFDRGISHHQRG